MRFASRLSHKLYGFLQIEINELAAARAYGVIVPACLAVVAARGVPESNLAYVAFISQVAQRVIHRSVAYRRQNLSSRFVNFARRHVSVARLHDLKHNLPLACQPGGYRSFVSVFTPCCHS
jgi:hypothetical protein